MASIFSHIFYISCMPSTTNQHYLHFLFLLFTPRISIPIITWTFPLFLNSSIFLILVLSYHLMPRSFYFLCYDSFQHLTWLWIEMISTSNFILLNVILFNFFICHFILNTWHYHGFYVNQSTGNRDAHEAMRIIEGLKVKPYMSTRDSGYMDTSPGYNTLTYIYTHIPTHIITHTQTDRHMHAYIFSYIQTLL